MTSTTNPLNMAITSEIANLSEHYHATFGDDFLRLIAALRLHGFSVLRADEAREIVGQNDDLWAEIGHPSVWIQAPSAFNLKDKLRKAKPGSPEHEDWTNQLIRANLLEQRRLLVLLETFYRDRTPSFYARLIVENIDLGESNLRSQGSSSRIVIDGPAIQKQWAEDSQAELVAFTSFLIGKLEPTVIA